MSSQSLNQCMPYSRLSIEICWISERKQITVFCIRLNFTYKLNKTAVIKKKKCEKEGFPRGSVVKNLPVSSGDTGSSPGPGRSHMPQSNKAHAPQLLSLCSRACEPQLLSTRAATTEACRHRARAPQQEKPPQWEARAPQQRVAPASRSYRKAHTQQQKT